MNALVASTIVTLAIMGTTFVQINDVTAGETATGIQDIDVAGPSFSSSEPSDEHVIRPGVSIDGCTGAFIFQYEADLYLSTAAHCFGTESETSDYCQFTSDPIGTTTIIKPGRGLPQPNATLAYSSWHTMIEYGENDESVCGSNDFALLKIDAQDHDKVHPQPLGSMPKPNHVADCREYGGSIVIPALVPVIGHGRSGNVYIALEEPVNRDGWYLHAHGGYDYECKVRFTVPAIPGDSGGPLVSTDGAALGVLSTITLAPETGTNNYSNLAVMLQLMEDHEGWAPNLLVNPR